MLPGYSLEPKPNMPDLATKRMLAMEKPVWREQTRLTSPEVRGAAASKSWRNSGRDSLSPPQ